MDIETNFGDIVAMVAIGALLISTFVAPLISDLLDSFEQWQNKSKRVEE